jgi:hypothetical protein
MALMLNAWFDPPRPKLTALINFVDEASVERISLLVGWLLRKPESGPSPID